MFFFFFKQKTAYEIGVRLVGSEMCIRDSASDAEYTPEDVLNDENLKECTAVKNGNVYAIPGDIEALDSPVPGGILASIWLAGILHPDQVSADMYTEEKAAFYETFYGIK